MQSHTLTPHAKPQWKSLVGVWGLGIGSGQSGLVLATWCEMVLVVAAFYRNTLINMDFYPYRKHKRLQSHNRQPQPIFTPATIIFTWILSLSLTHTSLFYLSFCGFPRKYQNKPSGGLGNLVCLQPVVIMMLFNDCSYEMTGVWRMTVKNRVKHSVSFTF